VAAGASSHGEIGVSTPARRRHASWSPRCRRSPSTPTPTPTKYRRAFLFEGVSWRNQYTRVVHGELTREQIRQDAA
jgi:hypothetical protein